MAILPIRRLNQAICLLTTGAHEAAFRNTKTIAECLADDLINAAKCSSNRYTSTILFLEYAVFDVLNFPPFFLYFLEFGEKFYSISAVLTTERMKMRVAKANH